MQQVQVRGFRLSPQQTYVWKMLQAKQTYRVQCALLLEGNLDIPLLQQALQQVVNQHSILRTTFHSVPGMDLPVQVITDEMSLSWHQVDLSAVESHQQKAKLDSFLSIERYLPFDLQQGSPLQTSLVTISTQRHLLLISLPSLCADAYTLSILVQQISEAYTTYRQGLTCKEEEALRYVDVAEWFHEILNSEEGDDGRAYWQKQALSTLPTSRLPFQQMERDSSNRPFMPACYAAQLNEQVPGQLQALAHQHSTEPSIVLLTCWHALLWRLSRVSHLAVDMLFGGRTYPDLRETCGLYARYLPIVTHVEGQQPFRVLLEQVQEQTMQAARWQDTFPVHDEQLSQLSWGFDFEERLTSINAGDLTISIVRQYSYQKYFPLKLGVVLAGTLLNTEWLYDPSHFQEEQIVQISRYFETLLDSALARPDLPLDQLEILSRSEQQHLLVALNQTRAEYPDTHCLQDLFEQQVLRTPTQLAVVCGDQQLTYEQLNAQANQLAHALRRRGVDSEVCVGLCLTRSVTMLVSLLGILKAGGAYVPLDPDHPKARLITQLTQCAAPILLTQQALLSKLSTFEGEVVCVDRDQELWQQEPTSNPSVHTYPEQLAYVIYTSGSTGVPKGVAITQRSLVNYSYGISQRLQIQAGMQLATVSTLAADLGHTVIFPSLISGGCLHVLSYETAMSGERLAQYLAMHPIDILKIVPSHFSALLASVVGHPILPRKALIFGGETLSWKLVEQIEAQGSSLAIFNHYGPTETTVGATLFPLATRTCHQQLTNVVPIGHPLANTEVYILDEYLHAVPPGVPGELYIGGSGVARGYLNQPEQTLARFVRPPFAPNKRVYQTGDQARYLPDGSIEFLGRLDQQVKIRGHRIELGEIEGALRQHPWVRDVVVVVREDQAEDKRVVAYLVARQQTTGIPDETELRQFLQEHLPDALVPSVFVWLSALPLNSNGKVDRKSLPAPETINHQQGRTFVAPRTPLEKTLADIWSDILGCERVGIYDNFFTLGGHSLLGVRLLSRIHGQFGQDFPLSALFQAATVAEMARMLSQQQQRNALNWSPIVPIQPLGSKPPFFCVHSVIGDPYSYVHLAQYLGPDQPFYGLQARGLDGKQEPFTNIEGMAKCYINALRTVQPAGPYLLGGHSFGGVVAFEMAQQLLRQGHEVALLALMDTSPWISTTTEPAGTGRLNDQNCEVDNAHAIVRIARILERFWGKQLSVSYDKLSLLEPNEQMNSFLESLVAVNLVPENTEPSFIQGFIQVLKANELANQRYVPPAYTRRIAYFCCEHGAEEKVATWQGFSLLPLETYIVPGEHISMITEPHVRTLAAQLTVCLNKALTTTN